MVATGSWELTWKEAKSAASNAAILRRRITQQGFVESEYADSITVELTTTTTHKVSLKRTLEWINNPGAKSPREASLKTQARTA
jgi:hypothetical protein